MPTASVGMAPNTLHLSVLRYNRDELESRQPNSTARSHAECGNKVFGDGCLPTIPYENRYRPGMATSGMG